MAVTCDQGAPRAWATRLSQCDSVGTKHQNLAFFFFFNLADTCVHVTGDNGTESVATSSAKDLDSKECFDGITHEKELP